MNIWWHNGGVRLDPESPEERAALALLWPDSKNDPPAEERVQHGGGRVQPCGEEVGSE